MAVSSDDQARLLITIEASQAKIQKQLAAIAKSAADSARNIEGNFVRANSKVANSFTNTTSQVSKAMRTQQMAAQNLGFQFNDIATQLASGTSPWRVMAQQLGQVTQALNQAGGGMNALRAVGGAIGSIVNPVGLATLAIGGLSAAAISYFTSTDDGADQVEATLKHHSDLIRRIKDAYGEAAQGLKDYSSESKTILQQDIRDQIASLKGTMASVGQDLRDQILSVPADQFGGATYVIQQIEAAVRKLEEGIAQGKPNIRAFVEALIDIENQSGTPEAVKELIQALRGSAEAGLKAQSALEPLVGVMDGIGGAAANNAAQIKAFAEAIDQLSKIALPALTDMEQAAKAYDNALKNATTERDVRDAEAAYAAAKERIRTSQLPIPEPRPDPYLYGDPVDSGKASRTAAKQFNEVSKSLAAEILRKFEGFRATPKYDVNALRAGYGSDTVTLSDGSVRKVTEGMRVSQEQANADLVRRIGDFQSGIRGQIGGSTFDRMNEQQQAALTSIAYNYGSLPERIVAAIKTGSDAMVVKAIQGLGADNKGVNAGRRNAEAQLYAGVPVENIERLGGVYEGLEGRINGASGATGRFVNEQERAAAMAQELGSTFASAFSGFIQDIIAGKDASEALANALGKIGQKLLDIALNQAFQGLFGGLLGGGGGGMGLSPAVAGVIGRGGVGLFHSGGVVGNTPPGRRNVNPGIFAGAPRYHSGGVAGLKPGEIPAILQRGEVVIPRGGMGGREGSMHISNRVQIRVEDGKSRLDTDSRTELARSINAAVQQQLVLEGRPGGILYNQRKRR